MRRFRGMMLGLLVLAAAGCNDSLVVDNNNNPDRDRALARPGDVENLAAGQFRVIHNALWNVTDLQAQIAVMGMESFSTNANFGMGVRSGVPRSLIDNSRGNPADFYGGFSALSSSSTNYLGLNAAARASAVALGRLDEANFTFFPTSAAQRLRARAFAYLCLGVAHGYLATMFDSTAVISSVDGSVNPLVAYDSVMRVALVYLDSAISIASVTPPTSPAGTGFPLPATWINGLAATGGATGDFVRLARSYKARFRSGVARTPAERAAVNWPLVIADAQAGLTANLSLTMTNATGGWLYRPIQMDLFQSWHQMWQGIVGMADTSGGFDAWLNTPRANKAPFLVRTPDIRFPAGITIPAQQTASGCGASACLQPAATAPYPYFRNRPSGEYVGVDGLFHSQLDFYRFQALFNANRNGPVIVFTRAELDMLIAEGQIRAGNFAAAMTAINTTRAARGLPALTAITSLADVVPGGTACVPRVPVGATNAVNATPTATACGNIMEAMKWEKRLETAFTHPIGWWADGRGWGDLPFNTPVQYPVPYTDLDSRQQVIYSVPSTFAGAGTATAAERLSNSASNYGYGN